MRSLHAFKLLTGALLLCIPVFLSAQTTGKIAGMVTEESTGEPLAGANVLVDGTSMGAAVGLDGTFYIINVPPDTYTLTIEMMGYEPVKIQDLRVSVNRTATVNIVMKPDVLETEVIVVQADRIANYKDQTGSIRTVSSEQMAVLPIENVDDVVSMQAGVVNGHFRGGRLDEVSYLIDGVQVDDAFGGESQNVTLEAEAVEDLEVITGNFNAEYGRAMSGVVNAVTKDGGSEMVVNASARVANYLTTRDDIFIGLESDDIRNQDYRFQISGPLLFNNLSYFINTRFQENKNHLNGIRRFNTNDFSYYTEYPDLWFSEVYGDSAYVPMNEGKNISVMGKLTYQMVQNMRLSFLYTYNDDEWQDYNHAYKYVPDGLAKGNVKTHMYMAQLNHMLGNSAFYELKVKYLDKKYGNYLFEDPTDPGYVHDLYHGNDSETGFFTGGQVKDHTENNQIDIDVKLDLTWQVSNRHSLKAGALYIYHDLTNEWKQIQNSPENQALSEQWVPAFNEFGRLVPPPYEPVVFPDSSRYSDIYNVKPYEIAAYLQDKMEYEDMVINLGVRLDYFDPKTVVPTQRRNPDNRLSFDDPDRMSDYKKAEPQYQISPRFSLAYMLGSRAMLRFSYGHFFQMPPMYAMYENNSFLVVQSDYVTTMGNAELKAQKTVQYEIGLKQQIFDQMWLDVSLYYRDIYNLLSTQIISTFNQVEYGLYTNKDYGNSKGLELAFDYSLGSIRTMLNYTLLFTRGNADNPTQTFDRAGSSQDPVNRLIPMSWDQRHTLNLTFGYYQPAWGVTTTGYYNSGSPYTWTPLQESLLSRVNLYPNNAYQPSTFSVDLNGFYNFSLIGRTKLSLFLNVYNLFDTLNEEWVNATTGRAYTAIIRDSDRALHRSNFNTYEDRVENPSMFAAPRMVKIGIGIIY